MKSICGILAAVLMIGSSTAQELSGPKIQILTPGGTLDGEIKDVPPLTHYAAGELKRILEELFDAKVRINGPIFSSKDEKVVLEKLILLGNPKTNPNIPETDWPKDLSDQGHLLKSVSTDGKAALVLGGDSPKATLWAVYELGHHFGMRYTLHEDFTPIEKPEFTIAGFDQVFEPNIKVRAWRTMNPGIAGQESWGLEDHRKLLRQLAKLKFNRLILINDPESVPAKGISVSGDTAGRSVFEGAKVFENPDFVGIEDDDGRKAARSKLVDGIKKEALQLGMAVTVQPHTRSSPDVLGIFLSQWRGSVVPQFYTSKLESTLSEVRKEPDQGFAVECYIPGNLNTDVYFLSRASFDEDVTPRQALDDLVTPICGEGVSDRLANGFAAIEEVSRLIAKNDLDFAVPDPEMFMKHFESVEEAPEWWAKATELYGTAVNEMYRGNTRARGGARPFILYHAKYFTFALHYMTAVQAARDAARAKDADDTEAYVEHLEAAVEAMHNALQIYADVARDNSDRGVIAVLNEYAYRPLLKALDEAPLP